MDYLDIDDDFSEQALQEVQRTFVEKNDMPMLKTKIVNALIIGKSGTGKTTLLNLLKDPTIPTKTYDPYSQTKIVTFEPFTVGMPQGHMTLNLIDTPGFREVAEFNSRTDEVILETIIQCIEKEITKIHLIILCVSNDARFLPDDYIAISKIKDALWVVDKIKLVVCITKCEASTREYFNYNLETMPKHELFKSFFELPNEDFRSELLFSGYVDTTNERFVKQEVEKRYRVVYSLRKHILNRIFETHEKNPKGCHISSFPFYNKLECDAVDHFKGFLSCLVTFVEMARRKQYKLDQDSRRILEVNDRIKAEYIKAKGKVFEFSILYDMTIMSIHFAFMHDILSVLYAKYKISNDWIYTSVDGRTYSSINNSSLNFHERLNRLPDAVFKRIYT